MVETETINLDQIRPYSLKENSLLQLIFPEQGLVHLRVLNKEEFPFMYTALTTIQPGSTDVSSAQRLGIAQFNITDAIAINYDLHLYQIFYGISPSIIRVRTGYPLETLTKSLDVRQNQITGDFGFVDGFSSPLINPDPRSEFLVPPNFDVGFVFENVDTVPIKPLLYWQIISLRVGVITDANLIYNIMAGKLDNIRNGNYIQRKTMGGISPYRYYPAEYYGIDYITFDVIDIIDAAESSNDTSLKGKALDAIRTALGQPTGRPETHQRGTLVPRY